MGFREAKAELLRALRDGSYLHETRADIDVKNMLLTGAVSVDDVIALVKRCSGTHYRTSPHHADASISVGILKRDGWYIKFYFLKPNVVFISVHK